MSFAYFSATNRNKKGTTQGGSLFYGSPDWSERRTFKFRVKINMSSPFETKWLLTAKAL